MVSKKTALLFTLVMSLCAFVLVRPVTSNALTTCHCCETSDSYGAKKDTFSPGEDVYVNGSCFEACKTFNIYVVADTTWCDQMPIPSRVAGTATTVSSDALGKILPTIVWHAPLTPGKYDIVIDVDGDCKYDEGIDCLDDSDVQVTAGFFVIPELLATIIGVVGCFAAYGVYRMFKHKQKANASFNS